MNRCVLLAGVLLMGCESLPQPPAKTISPQAKVVTEIIGHSVQNRPIERIVFPGDDRRAVLIIAAIHGNEQAGIDIARGMIDLLRAEPQRTCGRTVTIIPVVNPDGVAKNGRLNANRIDLNRDFPAKNFKPGPRARVPLAEPESKVLADEIQTRRPSLLITIHSIDQDRQCNNYDGPAEAIAQVMSRENGFPVTGDIGYPVPGSLGSWAGKELQIPMITLELPRDMSGPEAWRINRPAMLAALAQ